MKRAQLISSIMYLISRHLTSSEYKNRVPETAGAFNELIIMRARFGLRDFQREL